MSVNLNALKVNKIHALHDNVLVHNMNFGERTTEGGIVLMSDNGKTHGIKPRWAQVYAVGPDQKDFKVGDWICIEHGRWTRVLLIEDDTGEHELQKVELAAILLVSETQPSDDYIAPVNY